MTQLRQKITITEVAKLAGVSIGTVSRVLNNGSCKPETRQRVREAIHSLNYVPNHVARSLKRQTTEQIALVIPDIANPVYVAMAKSVQQTAKDRGFRLSLISTDGNSSEEEHALKSLEQKHVDGLIICSLRPSAKLVRQVERANSRICVIGQLPAGTKVDNIRVDSASGAALAVQHLVDQGRRVIGFINGIAQTVPAEARQRGYQRALVENHLSADPDLTVYADFTMAGGHAAVNVLLGKRPDIDAIFCANDAMALGVLKRLRELRRQVPEDIALVGMDDIELGKISTPTLTSVALLAGERGRIAAELLLERIAGNQEADEPHQITVMPKLIVRESSTDYILKPTELAHAVG